MAIKIYDRGSTILVEVLFWKHEEFVSESLFDPTTFTITVYQTGKTARVDEQDLVKSSTGKYYYYVQSLITWEVGDYWIKIKSDDGTYYDINDKKAFTLE